MTRELIFNSNFEPQLAASTAWKPLVTVQGASERTFAPSDFPGFEILPGEAKFTAFDSFGHPVAGTQAFTLRIHYSHSELSVSAMRSTRSGMVGLLESFFGSGFTLPPVSIGDTARIDSVKLVSIDPPVLSKTATRSTITAQCEYTFTIF